MSHVPENVIENSNYLFEHFPKTKLSLKSIKLDIFHLKSKMTTLEKTYDLLDEHIHCSSALAFNSSAFDIPLIRKYLLPLLELQKNGNVLKRFNQYILIKTKKLRFLDAMNFLPPNTNLQNFCSDMTTTKLTSSNLDNHKGFLPYDKIQSVKDIESSILPLYSDFFSVIKGCNSFEENISIPKNIVSNLHLKNEYVKNIAKNRYLEFKTFWIKNNCDMKSYVKYYCNKDTSILLNACKLYAIKFREEFNIELYNHISLPQISRKLMRLHAHKEGAILPNFSPKNSWIYYSLKSSLTAGSSQVYCRYIDENSKISENSVETVIGYDCTAMYSRALMDFYPTNEPISYTKNSLDDKYFSIEKHIQFQNVYLFLKWLEKQYKIEIMSKKTLGYEIKLLGFFLDGYIEKKR